MDGHYTLVASAFSRDPQKSTETARSLGVAPDRNYAIHTQMAQSECARADGIEAVAIVTPNNSHIPIACEFLRANTHVICDKPSGNSIADARALAALVPQLDLVFAMRVSSKPS